MTLADGMRPIGELLVGSGRITRSQLDAAVARQRREGGRLGRQLILSGALSRRELFRALSDQWGVPLVDLQARPPQPGALRGVDWSAVDARGWIPWRRSGTEVWIATSVTPTPEVLRQAAAETGAARVHVVATTDWDVTRAVQAAFRTELRHHAADELADQDPGHSARAGLSRWQRGAVLALGLVLVAGLAISPSATAAAAFALANGMFALNVGFKAVCAAITPFARRRRRRWDAAVREERARRGLPVGPGRLGDDELPMYSVLVPVYREANVVGKVITNLGRLDYPQSKLDVLILLEEDDVETIAAAKRMHPPEYVRIIVVPEGTPQTKPRACNYGLALARGEYVVIFDAEDRPDPDQLRTAVEAFRRADFERERHGGRPLACVQGSLNYFNADYNVLTRMFAVEYSHWFDLMLPGMDALRLPIPLGGTSNHFVTRMVAEIGGWDPYNVTEDADLGLRVDAAGYRTGVISSVTWEEAASQPAAWIRQRTRWVKGYMMTAAVNLRHPWAWIRGAGIRGAVTMLGLVLGTPLSFLGYPLAVLLTVLTYVGLGVSRLGIPGWLIGFGWANMLVSNVALIVISGIAAWRRYSWRVGMFAVFNPVYWFLHAAAAWRAAWQILRDPFRWEKTPHGLTGDYDMASPADVDSAGPSAGRG